MTGERPNMTPELLAARLELLRNVAGTAIETLAARDRLPRDQLIVDAGCYDLAAIIQSALQNDHGVAMVERTVEMPYSPRASSHRVLFDPETALFVDAAW